MNLMKIMTFGLAGRKVEGSAGHRSGGSQLYDLGKITRANRRNVPPALSGDAAITSASDLMNRRMRHMYANNNQTKRTIDLLRDLIVGSGFQAFCDPFDSSFGFDLKGRPQADIERALDYSLQADERFHDWATDPKQCDVAGNLTFAEMQALLVSESSQVGDYFMVEVTPKVPKGQVPLKYQIIEREQLDCTKDQDASLGRNQILNGIEIDKCGYEVGAYFYESHPHDTHGTFSTKSEFVPSSRYHHFYKKMRPSQHIGATWIHANGQTVVDRNKYTEVEIRSAVKDALFLLSLKTDNPGTLDAGLDPEDGDQSGCDIALGQNPIAAEIGKDDELQLHEPARPNKNAGNFFNILDHDHAGGANLSYYSQTGRFNETNQSGFRGAMNLEDAQMQPLKDAVAIKAVLPIRRRWNDIAMAIGHIDAISIREYSKERSRFNRYDVVGPGRNLLDPQKENDAIVAQLRAGLVTHKFACARLGTHWIRVMRQRKLEKLVSDKLGVVLDYSKGNGGNATDQQPADKQDGTE